MYFRFACSECGKNLKVREENVGRKLRCPYCQHAMTIKAPDEDLTEEDPWDQESSGSIETPQIERKRPSTKLSSAKAGLVKWLAVKMGWSEWSSAKGGWSDGTEVPLLRGVLIGVVLLAWFYGTVYAIEQARFAEEGYYFGDLFLHRGWVPVVLVFLMSWSIGILHMKNQKLSRQKNSMLFDLLPNEIADDITVKTVGRFTKHIRGLPVNPSQSFLINRVLRGLEHFRVLKSNPEVAGRLASQSEIDATAVESSYTLLKVFIWAIPILGFIGTVMGISDAVGGFSGSLDNAQDVEAMRSSLDGVTGGLATAFDTTLIALVMSLLVMFPTSSMQKAEEDLLNWVDEYCNENLLKRLKDGDRISGAATGDRKSMEKAIDAAMADHHAEFRTWFKKLDTIGGRITEHVVRGWEKVDKQLWTQYEQKFSEISDAIAAMPGEHSEIVARIESVEQRTVESQAQVAEELTRTVDRFQETMAGLVQQGETVQDQASGSMNQAAESLGVYFQGLEQGLTILNSALERLGEQQIVAEADIEPRRRWGFFRRGNGAS